jgi:hypothetical protein
MSQKAEIVILLELVLQLQPSVPGLLSPCSEANKTALRVCSRDIRGGPKLWLTTGMTIHVNRELRRENLQWKKFKRKKINVKKT